MSCYSDLPTDGAATSQSMPQTVTPWTNFRTTAYRDKPKISNFTARHSTDSDCSDMEHQEDMGSLTTELGVDEGNSTVEYQEDKVPAHLVKVDEEKQSREMTVMSKQKYSEALETAKLQQKNNSKKQQKTEFTLDTQKESYKGISSVDGFHIPRGNVNEKTENKNLGAIRLNMLHKTTGMGQKIIQRYNPAGPIPIKPSKYAVKVSVQQQQKAEEQCKETENLYHVTDTRLVISNPHPEPHVQESNEFLQLPEVLLKSTPGKKSEVLQYPMNRRPRGIAVIINNYDFHDTSSKQRVSELGRNGAHHDSEVLERLFGEELKFDVRPFQNLSTAAMRQKLKEIASISHEHYDCFVCCICSHGRDSFVLGSDCREISLDAVRDIFRSNNCPSLSEKPKIFFVQACKGQNREGIPVVHTYEDDAYPASLKPAKSDELVGHSTVEDHASFRHPQEGSVYIQTLVKYVRELRQTTELCQILTKVNQKVGEKLIQLSEGRIGKQMPKYESTLMKLLFFRDKAG